MTRDEELIQELLSQTLLDFEIDKLSRDAQSDIINASKQVAHYKRSQAEQEYCNLRALKSLRLGENSEDTSSDDDSCIFLEQIKQLSDLELKKNLMKEYILMHKISKINDND